MPKLKRITSKFQRSEANKKDFRDQNIQLKNVKYQAKDALRFSASFYIDKQGL